MWTDFALVSLSWIYFAFPMIEKKGKQRSNIIYTILWKHFVAVLVNFTAELGSHASKYGKQNHQNAKFFFGP